MSKVKWIKIATDVFDNRKVKYIETLPDGDAVLIVWFKILALAGNINDGGCIYFTKDIPYTEQLLSTQFNRPLTVIQLALKTFSELGMIDIVDDIIHVSNWERYQSIDDGCESIEAIREQTRLRVQKHREKRKLLQDAQECNVTVTDCNVTCNVTCNARRKEAKEEYSSTVYKGNNSIYKDNNTIYRDTDNNIHNTIPSTDNTITYSSNDNQLHQNPAKSPEKSVFEAEFAELWKQYPKKHGKPNALRDYIKARKDGVEFETIQNGLTAYIAYCERNDRYFKDGSTWFHQRSWDDDYTDDSVSVGKQKDKKKETMKERIDRLMREGKLDEF